MVHLPSLAVLKSNWDRSGYDYIDMFVPFARYCVSRRAREGVGYEELQRAMRHEFGLGMPLGALTTIVGRGVRRGELAHGSERVFATDATFARTFEAERHAWTQHGRALALKFAAFCHRRYSQAMDERRADQVLHDLLGRRSAEVLRCAVEHVPPPLPSRSDGREAAWVGAFIVDLYDSDPEGFQYLATVVKGSVLAAALILPTLAEGGRTFTSTLGYLDTPLVLDLVGFAGPEARAATRDLVSVMKRSRMRPAVFEHAVAEAQDILHGAERTLEMKAARSELPSDMFPTLDRSLTASDVRMLSAGLAALLRDECVAVRPAPTDRPGGPLDGARLEQPSRAVALDVRSVAAIRHLRAQRPSMARRPRLEDVSAILLTGDNHRFHAAAQSQSDARLRGAPLVMTRSALSTLLWLKPPLFADEQPRRRLVADCLAALRPSETEWHSYVSELDRLRRSGQAPSDEVIRVMAARDVRRRIMEVAEGEAERIASKVALPGFEAARRPVAGGEAAAAGETDTGEHEEDELENERARLRHKELELDRLVALESAWRTIAERRIAAAATVLSWLAGVVLASPFAVVSYVVRPDLRVLANWPWPIGVWAVLSLAVMTFPLGRVQALIRYVKQFSEARLQTWWFAGLPRQPQAAEDPGMNTEG